MAARYRYKSSIPCAKKVVVLKSFVIELLWYKRHLRNVCTRFQDACGCRGRSKAKGKGCNDAVPRDASVTTKGRKNRMWNQPLNLRKSQEAPGNITPSKPERIVSRTVTSVKIVSSLRSIFTPNCHCHCHCQTGQHLCHKDKGRLEKIDQRQDDRLRGNRLPVLLDEL